MAGPAVEPGRIRADDLSRSFEIRLVKARSLKETLLRRSVVQKLLRLVRDTDVHLVADREPT